jgi:hypothetical protein
LGYANGLSGIHAGNSRRPVALRSNVNESAKQPGTAVQSANIPAPNVKQERIINGRFLNTRRIRRKRREPVL